MIIDVTEDDIDEGQKGDCELCPIASAIKRAIPDYNVLVDELSVDFKCDSERTHCVPLPDAAQDFIRRFDSAASVEPFSFQLAVPVEMEAGISGMTP